MALWMGTIRSLYEVVVDDSDNYLIDIKHNLDCSMTWSIGAS